MQFPVITLSLVILLLGAVGVLRINNQKLALRIGMMSVLTVLVLGVITLMNFDFAVASIQFEEQAGPWHVGIDSLSLPLYILIIVISPLVLLFFGSSKDTANRKVVAGILIYELVLLGLVSALNLPLFWCWLLLELIPLKLLSGLWDAGDRTIRSTLGRYWLMMLVMLFLCIVVLVIANDIAAVFDWSTLQTVTDQEATLSIVVVLLFFGLSVRLPVFPFHGWLPVLITRGNAMAAFCFIAGIKVGIYGLYRFALPLLEAISPVWVSFIEMLALFSIFYGALLALMQININRLLAFAIVSHNGMLVIGLFAHNAISVEGSMLLSVAFGLASIGLILSTGMIREKTGTVFIPRLGSLFEKNTFPAILFLLAALSTMVMPGTPGYKAAHSLLEGVIAQNGWGIAIAILIGNVLAAAFLLRAFQQIYIAKARRSVHFSVPKSGHALRNEIVICGILCLLIVLSGFYPITAVLAGNH